MGNCAEYPAIWLGFSRVGIKVALINSQLSGAVLAHSINAVKPRLLVADIDRAAQLSGIEEQLRAERSAETEEIIAVWLSTLPTLQISIGARGSLS